MLKYLIKLSLLILSFSLTVPLLATDFNIKEQQNFFCNLEKYDQCFYQGKCKYKDYVNYTEYFTQITGGTLESTKHLYDSLPQIYRWSNKYYKGFESYLVYDQNAIFGLAYKYIILKYEWLSWYKNVTGISYKNPINIFGKINKNKCGAKIFNKYLSIPLPEDADIEVCFFNYSFIDDECVADDKQLRKNLFCKLGENCEIKW